MSEKETDKLATPTHLGMADPMSSMDMGFILDQARKKAKLIDHIIKDQNLSVEIKGKPYVRVEAWITLARGYGYVPDTLEPPAYIEHPAKKGVWGVRVKGGLRDLNTGAVISSVYAECWSDEFVAKAGHHAVLSMAQTRAASKACRMALSWVMVLAGYEGTPYEEMTEIQFQRDPLEQMNAEREAAEIVANQQANVIGKKFDEANAVQHLDNIVKKHKEALEHIERFAPDRAEELRDKYKIRKEEL